MGLTLYHLSVYLHVISAIVWVGGILFLGLIAVPALRRLDDERRSQLLDDIGTRFRNFGYTFLTISVITGVIQAGYRGATVANVLNGTFFQSTFGRNLALKLLFVALMVGVSISHDFFVGPAAVRANRAGQDTTRLRKTASWLARVTALLALIVIAYAVKLVR